MLSDSGKAAQIEVEGQRGRATFKFFQLRDAKFD